MNSIRTLFLTGALALAAAASALAQDSQLPIYLNTAYSFEERATDLVSRLTLEEKQSLLGNNMAAVPRLGLKSYNVWSEALHGVLSGANPSVGILGRAPSPTASPSDPAGIRPSPSGWPPPSPTRRAPSMPPARRA